MIPIKIQCGCGQKYTFDIEPVGGLMPWAVACPICGMDGTAAANSAITQILAMQPAPPVAARAPMRVAAPAPAAPPPVPATAPPPASRPAAAPSAQVAARTTTRYVPRLPGQIDPSQALIEARAKISWGDEPVEVVKYLMIQGFGREEARDQVREMYEERAKTIRSNGFRKIIIGVGLVCVPIIGLLVFLSLGFIMLKVLAVLIMAGLYGLWLVLKGLFMVISPKSESGDVSEQ